MDVIAHYDLLVDENNDPFYDLPELKDYMNKWDGQVFIDALQLYENKEILEIGLGTGRIAVKVASYCKRLTGIDISPKTIQRALDDIKHMTIDQGTITKHGGGTAFSIILFNDNYSDSLQINNPSFFMILCLIKNCKNAKVKFNNYKWYIVSCILFTVFSIVLCITGKNA